MRRKFIFLLLFLLLLLAVSIFAGTDKWVEVEILTQIPLFAPPTGFSLSLQAAVLGGTVLVCALIAFWSCLIWVFRLPKQVSLGLDKRRARQSLDVFEKLYIAKASGDNTQAYAYAEQLQSLLGERVLRDLVVADFVLSRSSSAVDKNSKTELAQREVARTALQKLYHQKHSKAQSLALKRLLEMAFLNGDMRTFLDIAQTAYLVEVAPQPQTSIGGLPALAYNKPQKWAFSALIQAHVFNADWHCAVECVELALTRKHVEKMHAKRLQAVFLTAQACHIWKKEHAYEDALKLVLRANTLSPDFLPASVWAVYLLGERKTSADIKHAKVIWLKAWKNTPHAALNASLMALKNVMMVGAYNELVAEAQSAQNAHLETRLMSAQHALMQNQTEQAFTLIQAVIEDDSIINSDRIYALGARIADVFGNTEKAQYWGLQALYAPLDEWAVLSAEACPCVYANDGWRYFATHYAPTGHLDFPAYQRAHIRRSFQIEKPVARVQNNEASLVSPPRGAPPTIDAPVDVKPSTDLQGDMSARDKTYKPPQDY